MRKHRVLIALLAAAAVLLCCEGRTELQQTCRIAGISVDKGTRMKYSFGFEIADVYHADRQTVSSYLLTAEGDTLSQALTDLDGITDGTPTLQHCGLILLGASLAARPSEVCAMLCRDWSGQSPYVAVTKGGAAELLAVREQQDLRARSVRDHLKNAAASAGVRTPCLERVTADALQGRSCEIPLLEPAEDGSRLAGVFRTEGSGTTNEK